uniref:Grass carp reovirus (GCRV)-induced gene 2p n=1 Tax=Oncorhynchus kisutch TaxID=8019 RepID=A0A8C7EZZ0_ONCKI
MSVTFFGWDVVYDDKSLVLELGAEQEPQKGDSYTMYHGTNVQTARLIITNGFRQSPDGMLGPGVYVSRNQQKAERYPLKSPSSNRVVLQLRVNAGRVKRIDKDNHPMQKSWNAAGYDTAWVPPNCGMQSVPSGLEEDCVFDPQRVVVTSIFLKVQSQKPSSTLMNLALMRTATGKEDPEIPLPLKISSIELPTSEIAAQINASEFK